MQYHVPERPTDAEGLLRLKDILGDRKARPPTRGLLPIATSTWWELVRAGEAPKPLKIGRASFWRAKDIYALIERISREGAITLPRRKLSCATPSDPAGASTLMGGRANAAS